MTAKEYLGQVETLNRRIKQAEEQIRNIKIMATSAGAIRYDKDIVQSTPTNDSFANYMIRLEKAEAKYRNLIMRLLDLRMKIEGQLRNLMPGLYADVLYMRWIECKKLEVVADELNYSYEYMRQVHGRALQAFARKYLDDNC